MQIKPPPINLGPPPWSEDAVKHAAYLNPLEVYEELKNHPGGIIQERLNSLDAVLRLFNKTAASISLCINKFHKEVHENSLFDRSRRHDQELIEQHLQEQLYIFAACSMTLVDQSRAITDMITVPGYKKRVAAEFMNNTRHKFIQELRVDMIHITIHEPSWQTSRKRGEDPVTRFLIHKNQLRRVNKYHKLAKQYVTEHPGGIDLAILVSQYQKSVNSLQACLHEGIENVEKDALENYRNSERIVRATGDRFSWHILLSQLVKKDNFDPYSYLNKYLTQDELQEVLAMPHRSKEQIDRIIEIVDENIACTVDIREFVYQVFKVVRH